jgi:hypothetical protein
MHVIAPLRELTSAEATLNSTAQLDHIRSDYSDETFARLDNQME